MSFMMESFEHWCDLATTDFRLKASREKYDFLACCGLSGLSVGLILSHKFNWPLLIQRRALASGNGQKRGVVMEGTRALYEYMLKEGKQPTVCFIDDCQGSRTINAVAKGLADHGAVLTHEYYYGRGAPIRIRDGFNTRPFRYDSTKTYNQIANTKFKAIQGGRRYDGF